MSSSPLKSFDPFAKHSFTDHVKGVMPVPPSPSKYAQGVPSTHVTFAYPQKPPSLPGTQPPSPLVTPIPQYGPPQMGIFTPFKPDGRGTPDLEDILSTKKKSTWNRNGRG
ncbi:hypothetical protein B0F90DRAFT_1378507 [Multifurca ochricompacta]|uniref:Uncharacterized protein n=1 Tax=Multifurca ochricompacta TaxID=376703 RepID=A0AAD4M5Y0_9AGAM|nr:hypothetical protein B0F90DRAFT_1378507 [Multifurca ochricompacta]